jgi:hypothetical protein
VQTDVPAARRLLLWSWSLFAGGFVLAVLVLALIIAAA